MVRPMRLWACMAAVLVAAHLPPVADAQSEAQLMTL